MCIHSTKNTEVMYIEHIAYSCIMASYQRVYGIGQYIRDQRKKLCTDSSRIAVSEM